MFDMLDPSFIVYAALRHTSVYPPPPHPLAFENSVSQKPPKFATTCIHSLEVMIQVRFCFSDYVILEMLPSSFCHFPNVICSLYKSDQLSFFPLTC